MSGWALSAITGVLSGRRSRETCHRPRRDGHGPRGQRPEPPNTSSHQKLEEEGMDFHTELPGEGRTCLHIDFDPVRLIWEF